MLGPVFPSSSIKPPAVITSHQPPPPSKWLDLSVSFQPQRDEDVLRLFGHLRGGRRGLRLLPLGAFGREKGRVQEPLLSFGQKPVQMRGLFREFGRQHQSAHRLGRRSSGFAEEKVLAAESGVLAVIRGSGHAGLFPNPRRKMQRNEG